MRINHNISAINTNRLLATNNSSTAKNLEKLSSGLAINRAGDNAAGLAISEKMRGQIRGLDQATSNANDGISLIQTAEGGLNETHAILQRMRELAVQSANDTNTDSDRKEIQKEVDQLATEITRISTDTEFNTKKLLNGNLSASASNLTAGTTGATDVKVAAGANLTSDGTYTLTVSNYTAGTNHGASSVTASVSDQSKLNTYASSAKTLTYDGSKWGDGANSWTAAEVLTNTGITVSGTAETGAKIDVSAYAAGAAPTVSQATTATETVTNGNGSGTKASISVDLTGASITAPTDGSTGAKATVTIGGQAIELAVSGDMDDTAIATALNGKKITVGGQELTATTTGKTVKFEAADDTATSISAGSVVLAGVAGHLGGTAATATVTNVAAKTDGTDTSYTLAVTDAAGKTVSNSAFDITGINSNGTATVDVSAGGALTFHIGANSGQNTKLTVQDMSATALGVNAINLTTQASADGAITTIDNAINTVSAQRAALGAMQNRLEHTINNLGTSSENLSAAESQIRDVDMAEEMSAYTKNNILVQAATSMLAQANQQPQNVLSLLR